MNYSFIASFALVWTMITRIPLPRFMISQSLRLPEADDMWAMAPAGAAFAAFSALPAWALSHVVLQAPCAWISSAVYVALGWSFHIDGWGDLWDGLGSGRRGGDMMRIMKDSRVGSFGVAGIVIAIALRSALLSGIPARYWLPVCALAGGVGRFSANVATFYGSYPWDVGIGRNIVLGTGKKQLAAAFIASCVLAVISPAVWLVSILPATAAGLLMSHLAERTLGGTNGDVLGAASVAGELLVLLVASGYYF